MVDPSLHAADCNCDECWPEEPDINDEPPPDYGPPGTGAVIVEYTGWEDNDLCP